MFKKGNREATKKGKHKKTLEAEAMRQIIREYVSDNLLPILRAQGDLAMGHLVQGRTGQIYTKSPDRGAAELLLAHGIGKPKESFEHTGKDGAPIPILATIIKEDVVSSHHSDKKDRIAPEADKSDTGRDIGLQDGVDSLMADQPSAEGSDPHPDEHSVGKLPTP